MRGAQREEGSTGSYEGKTGYKTRWLSLRWLTIQEAESGNSGGVINKLGGKWDTTQ